MKAFLQTVESCNNIINIVQVLFWSERGPEITKWNLSYLEHNFHPSPKCLIFHM